jgi:hypothetical protein
MAVESNKALHYFPRSVLNWCDCSKGTVAFLLTVQVSRTGN